MTAATAATAADCDRSRNLLFRSRPTLWPAWPFLPLMRRKPRQEQEYGLLCDALHVSNKTGYSATVLLCNLFGQTNGGEGTAGAEAVVVGDGRPFDRFTEPAGVGECLHEVGAGGVVDGDANGDIGGMVADTSFGNGLREGFFVIKRRSKKVTNRRVRRKAAIPAVFPPRSQTLVWECPSAKLLFRNPPLLR